MRPPLKPALVAVVAIAPLAQRQQPERQGGDGRVYGAAEVRQLALRQPGGWDGKVLRVRARPDGVGYYMMMRGPVDVILYGPGMGCPLDGPAACLPSGPVQAGTIHLFLDTHRVPGTGFSVLYEPCPARAGLCTAWPPPDDRLRALLRRVPHRAAGPQPVARWGTGRRLSAALPAQPRAALPRRPLRRGSGARGGAGRTRRALKSNRSARDVMRTSSGRHPCC